jgi:hypothetical protein
MSPRSSLGLGCGSRIKYLVVWSKVVEVSITVTIQYLIWVKAVRRKLSVLTPSSFTLGQAWRSTLFEREGSRSNGIGTRYTPNVINVNKCNKNWIWLYNRLKRAVADKFNRPPPKIYFEED